MSFIIKGYTIDHKKGVISFLYATEKGKKTVHFKETLQLSGLDSRQKKRLMHSKETRRCIENLLLMLGISYWKTYCPKKIIIASEALEKPLSYEQAQWWNTVYTRGLGEFFYKNKIDYRNLVNFPYDKKVSPDISLKKTVKEETARFYGAMAKQKIMKTLPKISGRSLLLFGGGKDSIVSAELLKTAKKRWTFFVLNEYPVQKKLIQKMKAKAIVFERTIDPQLLKLNEQKQVYNGHVPVTFMYSLNALLAASLYDYQNVILSNEESANYGNVKYMGEMINHQWSKSHEAEKLLQRYLLENVTSKIRYFSLLRTLREIDIAEIFSFFPQYFNLFSSCNRNFTIKKRTQKMWCGECPKCAFVFALLSAYIPKKDLIEIFGKNLYADKTLVPLYEELLGYKTSNHSNASGHPKKQPRP